MGVYFSDARQGAAAHLVNWQGFSSNTRATLATTSSSSSSRETLWSVGNYNKLHSNSQLVLFGFVTGYGDRSGALKTHVKYGNTEYLWGWNYQYSNMNYLRHIGVHITLTNHTTTGNQLIQLLYSGDGSSGERPCTTFNPGNSDDDRIGSSSYSRLTVFEILPGG